VDECAVYIGARATHWSFILCDSAPCFCAPLIKCVYPRAPTPILASIRRSSEDSLSYRAMNKFCGNRRTWQNDYVFLPSGHQSKHEHNGQYFFEVRKCKYIPDRRAAIDFWALLFLTINRLKIFVLIWKLNKQLKIVFCPHWWNIPKKIYSTWCFSLQASRINLIFNSVNMANNQFA
jgi:hypothetical protein